jgi:hypothetical protein
MVLVSPHTLPYDLILLAPVYLLLASWVADRASHPPPRAILLPLYALFVSPLLGMLPAPLRLQFSVTAMAFLLVRLWQAARCGEIGSAAFTEM